MILKLDKQKYMIFISKNIYYYYDSYAGAFAIELK